MDNESKRYIVRRLTPLECTRLQGYPDGWVDLPPKEDMSDEEFAEWNNIRRVWANANGKDYKPCKSKESMIAWYNKMIEADGAKYKALGNSIATGPNSFWEWVIKRISAQYDRRITLGSLFDGISGFPLVFEQINGKGSCRWASEIEPFPIAVTKVRFPDDKK